MLDQEVPHERVENQNKSRYYHLFWATAAGFLAVLVLLTLTGQINTFAREILQRFSKEEPAPTDTRDITTLDEKEIDHTFSFRDLDIHPDLLYQPFTAGPILADAGSDRHRLITKFRQLLTLYHQRQGIDDNFTIRVVDGRNGKLLELFSLDSERERYDPENDTNWDWHRIDVMRREHTRRLVEKYVQKGVPREAVTIKWGRKNQVLEARKRDLPFIEYEVRLARYLGLSLLATEIGTVETFNFDRLVSPVGARSRYQMMPYLLRSNGIYHYSLRTASGKSVSVFEEWNPLLVMEPAFLTLRGYVNAVGHEIPGISAYHTGPGNIFKLLSVFLSHNQSSLSSSISVMDAYMWALTEGFETVSSNSSFGNYSRGYVASGYGALRAVDGEPVDTSHTVRAERVQIQPGKEIFLSHLLQALEDHEHQLSWGGLGDNEKSLYNRFRQLNLHISLPQASDSTGVPVSGDIRLVAEADGVPVRFFLPIGATRVLTENGLDVFDDKTVFRFDHTTYASPMYGEKTMWDRQYESLVADAAQFGFTRENRSELAELVDRFEELARENPSHYRKCQLQIIKIHEMAWSSSVWQNLASVTASVQGRLRAPARPIVPLPPASESLQPTNILDENIPGRLIYSAAGTGSSP